MNETPLLTKLRELEPKLNSNKITYRERSFLSTLIPTALAHAEAGHVTRLSDKQLEVVNDLYHRLNAATAAS